MKRKRIFLAVSALVILLFSLLLSEIFLRWQNRRNQPIETRSCRISSPRYHHELVPGTICRSKYPEWDTTFSVNNLGFRDTEMTIDKPAGVFRVLMIGDSFIEGEAVELDETAAQVMETELSQSLNRQVEVVNMGVMSYSPIIYRRVLEDKGLPLNPDLVIIAVDMSDWQNDFSYEKDLDQNGNFRNVLFQQQMGRPHQALPGVNSKIKFWLRTNSIVYATVADRIKQLIRRVKQIPEPTVFQVNDPLSDPHFVTRSDENAKRLQMWHPLEESLVSIDELMKKSRVPWIAVTYPYGHQVSENEWVKGRLKNGFEADKIYPTAAADLLIDFGTSHGIKVFNLIDKFKLAAKTNQGLLYYPMDGHFTPLGHKIMAQSLEEIVDDYIAYNR